MVVALVLVMAPMMHMEPCALVRLPVLMALTTTMKTPPFELLPIRNFDPIHLYELSTGAGMSQSLIPILLRGRGILLALRCRIAPWSYSSSPALCWLEGFSVPRQAREVSALYDQDYQFSNNTNLQKHHPTGHSKLLAHRLLKFAWYVD